MDDFYLCFTKDLSLRLFLVLAYSKESALVVTMRSVHGIISLSFVLTTNSTLLEQTHSLSNQPFIFIPICLKNEETLASATLLVPVRRKIRGMFPGGQNYE